MELANFLTSCSNLGVVAELAFPPDPELVTGDNTYGSGILLVTKTYIADNLCRSCFTPSQLKTVYHGLSF